MLHTKSHRTSKSRKRLKKHCVLECIKYSTARESIDLNETSRKWSHSYLYRSNPPSPSYLFPFIYNITVRLIISLALSNLHICSRIFKAVLSFPHLSIVPAAHTESRADATQSWSVSPRRSNCVQIARLCGNLLRFPVAAAATGPHGVLCRSGPMVEMLPWCFFFIPCVAQLANIHIWI